MSMVAYITEDYKFDGNMIQNMEGAQELRGMPLEYTIEQPQISMTFTANEVKTSVDSSVFEFDTSDYEVMSAEDMQNMGGGMGF
jgi:diacylglycerol kinase family enzyme